MTGLVVTLVLFAIAGGALRRRPLGESFLLGSGIVGTALFIAGLLHLPLWSAWFAAPLAFVRPSRRDNERPPNAIAVAVILIVIAVLAFVVAIVPLADFDGRVFWLLKAKGIAHDRAIDGPFFHGAEVYSPRNQYPLLMPLDAAAIMILTHDADDAQVRWLYLGISAALAFVVARRISPWAAVVLVCVPQFAVASAGSAITAYCDIAIAAFATCAFLAMRDREAPLYFGVWLAFLVLTKSEGLPLAMILFAIGCVVYRRAVWPALLPFASAVAMLLVWRTRIPHTDEENFLARLPLLPRSLHLVPGAIAGLVRSAVEPRTWGFFWFVAIAGLVMLAKRREWIPAAVFLGFAGLYVLVYTITEWPQPELIAASADRLLMHLAGPALAGVACVIDASARSR